MSANENDRFIGAVVVIRHITKEGAKIASYFFVPRNYGDFGIEPDEFIFDIKGGRPRDDFNCELALGSDLLEVFSPFENQTLSYQTNPGDPFTEHDAEICEDSLIVTTAYPIYAAAARKAQCILDSLALTEELTHEGSPGQIRSFAQLINCCGNPESQERLVLLNPLELMITINKLVAIRIAEANIPQVIPLGKSEFDYL